MIQLFLFLNTIAILTNVYMAYIIKAMRGELFMVIDKKTALEVVREDGDELFCMPEDLRDDKDVVLMAMSNKCSAVEYASSHLKLTDSDIAIIETYFLGGIMHSTAMKRLDLANDAVYNAFVGVTEQKVPQQFRKKCIKEGVCYNQAEVDSEIERLKKLMQEKRAFIIYEKEQESMVTL